MDTRQRSTYFRRRLQAWFSRHRRALPWRATRDPYRILVSEIMLQQTQVDRVMPKYRKFLRQFPTLRSLARASRADVVKAWSGLGYNRRALALHAAAQRMVADNAGNVPQSVEQLEALPGIGPYTARAILTFAFRRRVVALDTNQLRVYQRFFFGMKRASMVSIARRASSALPSRRSDLWNHALMDFGALVCRSRPRCALCPLRNKCAAYPAILEMSENAHARKGKPFLGSNRYLRGRILEHIRTLPASKEQTLFTLQKTFSNIPGGSTVRARTIIRQLEREGFLLLHGSGRREKVRLRE
ncbi:MAG: A/G-specific adenine glycosylase [bacterium]